MSFELPTPFRRILVAEAPVRTPGERRARPLPCKVGVLPWSVERSWLSILVVARFRFDTSSAARPIPLEPAPPRDLQIGSSEGSQAASGDAREAPDEGEHTVDIGPESLAPPALVDDFVPMRPLVDLTLSGHVEIGASAHDARHSRRPVSRRAEIGLGDKRVSFVVRADGPGKIPLRPPYTQLAIGHPIDLRPQPCHDGSVHRFRHAEEFDLVAYQAAIPEMQHDLEAVTGLFIAGLWPDPEAALQIELPKLAPRALVDYSQPHVRRGDVRLFLDNIAVDIDRSMVDVTWRGLVETTPKPHLDVDRILLGWAPPSRWRSDPEGAWEECLRELPRGLFHWAIEREDVVEGKNPPELTEEELAMARYRTWGHPNAAEPELPPEEAAVIAAELAEQRWPRREVLAKHGIDEYSWGIEERAWAQRLASVREDPSGGPSVDFARAFRRATEALATPREAEITPLQYVALAASMARGDPTRALAEAGLGLAAFGRIERRFRAQAAADRAFAAELERLRTEEAARRDGPGAGVKEEKPA
jgi:hypothetical protein